MELFDATIRLKNYAPDPARVNLWYVRGIPRIYYPTKIAAEIAVRAHFPDEDMHRRYDRINYHQFVCEG